MVILVISIYISVVYDYIDIYISELFESCTQVIFPLKMMHGSLTNQTDRLRFSCDVRFQPTSHPVDPRYAATSGEWKANCPGKLGRLSALIVLHTL